MSNGYLLWVLVAVLVALGLVALVVTSRPRRHYDEPDRDREDVDWGDER